MNVIKRDGREDKFQKGKITLAIQKASDEVEKSGGEAMPQIAIQTIATEVYNNFKAQDCAVSVENIQDAIESLLMQRGYYDVAKTYIRYRYERQLARNGNTTDGKILSIVDGVNEDVIQENSNKNPKIAATQRDYIAGEVSRDIVNRLILPKDIREAHEQGLIHFHDSDYAIQRMHNCFKGNTRFVTDDGVKEFRDFNDGETVKVIGSDGEWHIATVKKYGKQKMQDVMIQSGRSIKHVLCTSNHRWLLNDGSVTTNLKEGMVLASLPELSKYEMKSKEDYQAWAIGFAIGDGVDKKSGYTTVRLCGEKSVYVDYFVRAGYTVTYPESYHGDAYALCKNAFKQDFLNAKAWRFLNGKRKQFLFDGFYAADGAVDTNRVSTVDDRVAEMIRDISSIAGFYIASESETVHDTNFKKNARLINFRFRKYQNTNNLWVVKKITPYRPEIEYDAWCVEEPETHSFTLDGGVITGNCCLINLEDMLQNGTVINGTLIEKPHSFATACNIATQVMAQVASNQYGGQSESLAHLVPFIDVSRKKIRKQVMEEVALLNSNATDEQINEITEGRLKEEIKRGVQTIQYQINTLMTTNGQTPFVSIFLYLNEVKDGREKDDFAMLIEEVLKQRIEGTKNEQGVWITPAFPKILYVLEEDNIHEGDKYYYLTELAAKCTAKRMVPDYISEKKMLEYKGDCFPCMGCRSFLTPDRTTENLANANNWIKGKKYYGRFNQGVVTINLADVGLSANKDFDKFWKIFDERLELCHRALQIRHNRLLGTLSDVSPIHWQHGGLARLKKGEKIDKLLYDGYSTISLGYAGLYECVLAMTGKSHTSDEAKPFALEIMQHMNDKCNEWKAAENIDYSLYGSPIESTTYKFAKCLKKRFGVIPGITDRNYITNSYHVVVTEKIDAFTKLKFESEFQKLSPGGAISYIEIPNLNNNVDAVLSVIKFIYDNIMYAELNTKCDYCQVCGYDGEIQIVKDDDGKLVWECPNCKNRDKSKMNIVRRTCGYLGTNDWNQGRTQEIKERVVHLGVQ